MLSYREAREIVVKRLQAIPRTVETESVPLRQSLGRFLACDVKSDRDYPPFDRSIRDGYAVRAADTGVGVRLKCIGELKAGDTPSVEVTEGTCVEIMTGAAVPAGADAVVMVEHVRLKDSWQERTRHGQKGCEGAMVTLDRAVPTGRHVVRRGSEAAAGQTVLTAGRRVGFATVAWAAQVGAASLVVARKPRVAVLTTGDELVEIHEVPGPFQIRNSNAESIAAQVSLQLAEAVVLGNAKDSKDALRAKVLQGLEADMLILSGGVSMGKYDLVEPVLRELGAETVFDAVAIRPGKPTVLAICQGKPVFGLPGNPVSTMVTFDLFVPPALDILAGADEAMALPFTDAILTEAITEKPGLTHFLPAKQMWPGSTPRVTPVVWQGSGDVAAMTRANCLLVVPAERERIEAGERVQVLPRGLW